MKALLLLAYYEPEIQPGSVMCSQFIESLINSEIKVEIITPIPTRGISKELVKKYKRLYKEEKYDGNLIINRFRLFGEKKNPIQRGIRYILCNIIEFGIALKKKDYDIIFVYSTPPTQGLMASALTKLSKRKFIYCVQDIFPDSLLTTGLISKKGIIWKIGRLVEDFSYKYAERIIVISDTFKKNLIDKKVCDKKIEVVYNWINTEKVAYIERCNNYIFSRYKIDKDSFIISYSGNIGLTQNWDLLIKAAKKIQSMEQNIIFLIIGDGCYKEKLKIEVSQAGLRNVVIVPFQDESNIPEVFSVGDVGLVISKEGVGNSSVPSKTWNIMATSRPVLASFDFDSELGKILNEADCGLISQPDDIKGFISNIFRFKENKGLCYIMGNNGRNYVKKNLSVKHGTQEYIRILKECV